MIRNFVILLSVTEIENLINIQIQQKRKKKTPICIFIVNFIWFRWFVVNKLIKICSILN